MSTRRGTACGALHAFDPSAALRHGVLFQRYSGSTSTGFGDDIEAGVFVPLATFITGLRLATPGGGFNFKLAFTAI